MSAYDDGLVESGICWSCNINSPSSSPNMPYIQLFNPSNSGKNIYLDMAIGRAELANQIGFVWANSPLGSVATDILPNNMKNGSQTGYVAEVRRGSTSTQLLYPVTNIITYATFDFIKFYQPRAFILEPGHGMAITSYSQSGVYLIGGFYWREVSIE